MGGEVDKEAWATTVAELVDSECRGNKSAFARRVIIDGKPISPRTAYGWINGEYEVRESSVRAVAQAFGLNAMEMLIKVGFYRRDELPQYPSEVVDEEQLRVLNDSTLEDRVKVIILEKLEEMRADDQAILNQQAERDRRRRMERIDALRAQYTHERGHRDRA